MQQAGGDQPFLQGIEPRNPVRRLAMPVGVVPEQETALRVGGADGDLDIVDLQRVGVSDEYRIDVSRRHVAGDLGTGNDQDVRLGHVARKLERAVPVGMGDVSGVRLVLDMLGHGHGGQPVALGLLHADIGPHAAIGEDTVRVEVHGQNQSP